jgi:predicted RNA-binding protein with PIN domain
MRWWSARLAVATEGHDSLLAGLPRRSPELVEGAKAGLVVLSCPGHAPGIVAFERHLLVDGANIIHAWPDLRALAGRDKDAARAQLSQIVRVLHDAEAWRVTVVFDGRGPELSVVQPGGHPTFAHVFTPDALTADSVIEQLVGGAADPAACTVATADRAEQQTVAAAGAAWCSPDDLRAWCDRAAARQAGQIAEMKRANDRTWRGKGKP